MRFYFLVPVLMLLASCDSDHSNFYADCNGKITTYSQGILTVEKETRRYNFFDNKLVDRECSSNKGIIFCYGEVDELGSRSKEQLVFDKGYYTLTDIKTTITATKSNGASFVNTQIYQANCPMTIHSKK